MTMRMWLVLTTAVLAAGAWGKGEYSSTYLYTEPKPDDKGGIVLTLAPGSPKPDLAVAIGRGAGVDGVFRAKIAADGKTLTWEHLPVDIYDVLVISGTHFWEGIRLTRRADAQRLAAEKDAVEKEVRGVEGFFDGKILHRLEVEGEEAVVLLQQYRIGVALAESGAVLEGTIHSLDLIWFEKPVSGWQLLRRRQLYREELPFKEPMTHHHLRDLAKIRVIDGTREVGPIQLTTTGK